MFRPAVFRSAVRATALPNVIRPTIAARFVSTHEPTGTSEPPPAELKWKLEPGQEVDPQLNGYPQLPYVHLQTRPPLGWWDLQERKNFGELVHEEEDVLGMWGPDHQPVSGPKALGQITIALSLLGCVYYVISLLRPEPHFVRREFPYNGLEAELGGHVPARVAGEDDEEDEE